MITHLLAPAWCALALAAVADQIATPQAGPALADAQLLFYNAKHAAAADLAATIHPSTPDDELARDELRTSALLFQLKALLRPPDHRKIGRDEALKRCATCADLIASFMSDFSHGLELARARLRVNPSDETALFYIGKLNLNYVWLQLEPLGRKTGWDQYWEARKSLDALLKLNPAHVRGRVARAWIDYIVDTRMPWGTEWLLGGGDKKKALTAVREAAAIDSDMFTRAEAEFALWDMLVRERQRSEAAEVARRLIRSFPDNRDLAAFVDAPKQP
jgi:tetratricopeptide (TPR) repeat protein